MRHKPALAGEQPAWFDWTLQRLAGMARVA